MIVHTELRQKYSGQKRTEADINRIVIHGSGGSSGGGLLKWMSSSKNERINEYNKSIGLFPYLIDRNGDTYELFPDIDWFYHSGCGMADKNTIGIELVNPEEKNEGIYTDEQYTSLFKLISVLLTKYFTITTITDHDYQRKTYSALPPKGCIGKHFKWEKLQQWIDYKGIDDLEILR